MRRVKYVRHIPSEEQSKKKIMIFVSLMIERKWRGEEVITA